MKLSAASKKKEKRLSIIEIANNTHRKAGFNNQK